MITLFSTFLSDNDFVNEPQHVAQSNQYMKIVFTDGCFSCT